MKRLEVAIRLLLHEEENEGIVVGPRLEKIATAAGVSGPCIEWDGEKWILRDHLGNRFGEAKTAPARGRLGVSP